VSLPTFESCICLASLQDGHICTLRTATIRVSRRIASTIGEHVEPNLQPTMLLLTRTPAVFNALLRDLPETWTLRNEGENTWSAFDVVGHLIHGERTDWMPRARMVLQFGESQTFEPFDRWGQKRESRDKSLEQLLDEFACLRSDNLSELRALNLRQKDLELRGRHPALGVVTLSELLATWAIHDLTHLHQISRVMAHQYRDAVGPWSGYLGVLQCAGHSSP
jgi:DinB family protein